MALLVEISFLEVVLAGSALILCQLPIQSTDPADKDAWKDKGTGQLSIKCKEGVSKGSQESKPTIVVRNDVSFQFELWSSRVFFEFFD